MRSLQFPVKGTFYYAADIALQEEPLQPLTQLQFQLEPDNPYDHNAIQIWLKTTEESPGLLLGYVPRSLAKQLHAKIREQKVTPPEIIHCASLGRRIEIDCRIAIDHGWLPHARLWLQAFWTSRIYSLQRKLRHWLHR